MRDDHLIQEKIDLSLERRQVALLAAIALVLLGGVFALGVLVGRQLASAALSGPHPAAAGDLAALDAQKDDAQLPVRQAAPVAAPAPAEPAPRALSAAANPAPAAGQVATGSARADSADDSGRREEREAKKPADARVVVVPAPKPATIAAPKPPARAASGLPLAPPPKQIGAFTVQLGASQDRVDAQRLEDRARSAGLRPYLVEVDLGPKGIWYRVRVGAFGSREAAERYRKDVERELRGSAIVMPSH
jgi:cell division septation protein DedD